MRFFSPRELKSLSLAEVTAYCTELRRFLIQNVSRSGGHLASNLGVVEISTALCRVLDPYRDRIIYDTGHQSYVHKILTGRGESFSTLRSLGGISGFPNRLESSADPFGTGHSGTGLSAALGCARAMRLRGENHTAVAVIGDGSFSGGMAFEALNNIQPEDRLIIILNDNGMSISRSVGTLKGAFNRMRTRGYYRLKGNVRRMILGLPAVGSELAEAAKKMKDSVKRVAVPQGNLFEQYGLNYFGPADGNDVETVEFLLREALKKDRPSILHLCTVKGKGYAAAEQNPSLFHGISPKESGAKDSKKSFSALFGEALCRAALEDPKIVGITAAMADGVGMQEFARRFPQRFFDIGIAEEHAMTFAAALAAEGMKPCFAVYSTFFQRSIDQFLHDAALQGLPAVVCLDRAGLSGEDGATHHGLYDLPLTLPVPGVKIYAPVSQKEMERALKEAFLRENAPSVIRYPKGKESDEILRCFPCEKEIEARDFGTNPASLFIVTFGRLTQEAVVAAEALAQGGISCRVVRFGVLKGFDSALAKKLLSEAPALLFAEEGMKEGGFSRSLLGMLREEGALSGVPVKILAVEDRFVPHGATQALLKLCGLDAESIEKEGRNLVQIGCAPR